MRTRSSSSPLNIWPGFVDALSALVLVMLFVFMVFIVAQFYLSDVLNNREKSLTGLSQVVASLKQALSSEQDELSHTKQENERLTTLLRNQEGELLTQSHVRAAREQDLAAQEQDLVLLREQAEQLNEQLREISKVLQVSVETDVQQKTEIKNLTAQLNTALRDKVKELSGYRSEFFGKLKSALGGRKDIRVVGDRFVFQSEVLFSLGSDKIGVPGQKELRKFADALREIAKKIPPEMPWVLRVDGHTDVLPIKGATFPSNWELSVARALAVVKFLVVEGIPPQHLVAAGFGEFHPIDPDSASKSFARNRRIEFKLDQR